ncbi:helix-turn-helix domain-containing protein [Clostridium chauvoei]|uniref:helix-turn-helix domain-containing protein n=1 Tax=Clostridium chauvoei TaxID=46867 RepID=UPI001C85F549|nr:helix-turn-helix transcriptional regulator [Clostridium chauvoei]MBX7311060.1 helix-turn-helix domain-containing protein [Clostridium chauvoei]MBX7316056.1 helix-turn-helix domain-containing protein [Clostridium chauvoei]MBX7343859.1 helix-turn-helix domain-containing protein [Clostridium chauvoei]
MNTLLKDLRIKSGKTQEEVARVLGYSSKSGYSMLENGTVELTISKVKILAELYGIEAKIFLEI